MSKKLNVTKLATAIAELINAAIGGDDASNDDSGDTTEKRGRGRPAGSTNKPKPSGKKQKPAEDEEDDDGLGDEEEEDDGLGDEEEEEDDAPTQEEVVAAFKALKASKGVDACRTVLKEIGETNALNIPEKKFAKALAAIKKAGGKK